MNTLYSLVLSSEDIWEPDFEGVFLRSNSRLFFAHRRGKSIVFSAIEERKAEAKVVETTGTDLPANWLIVNNGTLLMYSEHCCIDLNTMQSFVVKDEHLHHEYLKNSVLRGLHLIYDTFVFGEYQISHYKECGLKCEKTSKQIWKANCRGYLYTDIILYNDCILFGTAGMGGHFYVIKLSNGEIKCDINTRGTGSFIVSNDKVYLLSREEKSKILKLSADTWNILDEIVIPGKVSSCSRLAMECDRLYAVSFLYKSKLPRQAIMNVIMI